jgi:hypothetical protein
VCDGELRNKKIFSGDFENNSSIKDNKNFLLDFFFYLLPK